MENKEFNQVTKLLEEVTKEMCDSYCKYPMLCSTEEDLESHCTECPLNRL